MENLSSEVKSPKKGQDQKHELTGRVRWDDTLEPVSGSISLLAEGKEHSMSKLSKDGVFRIEAEEILKVCREGEFRIVVKSPESEVLYTSELQETATNRLIRAYDILIKASLRPSRKKDFQMIKVGDLLLNALEVEKAKPEDVIRIARALVYPKIAEKERDKIARLSEHLVPVHGAKVWRCETPILLTIEALVRLKRWPREVSLEIESILRMREDGFAEQTHECPNFTVTYQDSGVAAVPSSTAAEDVIDPGSNPPVVLATLPAGGAPTYIKRVCFWLERALAAYVNAPFSMLNPAGGGKIQVIVNSSPYGSASPSAFYINNNLDPDVLCAVAVHELFHMVQYEYGGSGTWRSSVFEGGAVFAEDTAADLMNRYIDETRTNFNGTGVLANPNLSLDTSSYKASLLWRYIAEQHSPDGMEPFVGVETYRKVIEKCSAGSYTTDDVKSAVRELPWYQDFYEFHFLDAARLDRTNSETTFGNYALACYLKDLGINKPDSRFDFKEDEENIHIDNVIGGGPADITSMPSVTVTSTVSLTASGASSSISLVGNVAKFASRYYVVNINSAVTNVQVGFNADAGFSDLLFQIVQIDEAGNVRDIHRSDRASYSKRITNDRDGVLLDRILIVVSGCEQNGGFSVNVSSAVASSDVMVTRWHSAMKREYEIDSLNWAWTWVSPDIWVDNDNNGVADSEVYFNYNNKLNIRLHNKGNALAENISVAFYYQNAAAGLSDGSWLPVRNTASIVQSLSGLSLAAGASDNWSVDWSPLPDGTSQHFCIRAVVTVPGDPNTDNKRVLSNFGNVVSGAPFFDIRLIRRNVAERPLPVWLRVIPRLPSNYIVSGFDLKRQEMLRLEPGEIHLDEIRIYKSEQTREKTIHQDEHLDSLHHSGVIDRHIKQKPGRQGLHPTEADALPPGVAGRPMVTVVHEVDGLALGGVTFLLSEKK